jgi:PIN domain nuclease of toxin-antitoxin system
MLISILMCVPVAWIYSEKLAEVVSALMTKRGLECRALIDAVGERSIAAVKFDKELVVEIVDLFEVGKVERYYLIAPKALNFFTGHALLTLPRKLL